jgi:hypothetical protein
LSVNMENTKMIVIAEALLSLKENMADQRAVDNYDNYSSKIRKVILR